MDSIIEIISWVGALQGILLVLLLMTRDNNKSANRLLALFIVIITLDCLEPIIFKKGEQRVVIQNMGISMGRFGISSRSTAVSLCKENDDRLSDFFKGRSKALFASFTLL